MRGVGVGVEQRGWVQGCCWFRMGLVKDACSGAACCCDVWAAARQPDGGVVLRRGCCELCGRGEQRAVVGIDVCDCCGLELRERGVQRAGARGARGWVEC